MPDLNDILQLIHLADDIARLADDSARTVDIVGEAVRSAESKLKIETRNCLNVQAEALHRYRLVSTALASYLAGAASTCSSPPAGKDTPEGGDW